MEEVARSVYNAMKGFGTDEKRLIKELVGVKSNQRHALRDKYKALYGSDLEHDIKKEVGGGFETALTALLDPIDEYDAKCLRNAIHGLGTNEKVVIETLCPKDAHEIEVLKAAYKRVYNHEMEQDLSGEQVGGLGHIFRSIASGGRDSSRNVDSCLAEKEADDLYKAGEGKFGTEESEFVRILCTRSFPQLAATFDAYAAKTGHDIDLAIKRELTGDMEKACLAIAQAARNKPAYFARELHEAMAGVGTKENDLIRLLVSRSESDMNSIKANYRTLYGKSLADAVKSETAGDLENVLVAIIGK